MDKTEIVNRMLADAQDLMNQRMRAQMMNPTAFQEDRVRVKLCGQEFQVPGSMVEKFVGEISEWSKMRGREIMLEATEKTNEV